MNLTRTLRRRSLPAPDQAPADPVPGPPDVEVAARHLRIGDDYAATLAVTGYPADVAPGWLEPLLSYPGRLDVALHIDPVPPAAAADRLRRQRARLESGRRAGADRGQLDDPDTEAAAGDARELAYRIARGEGKLFRLGLYLTVHAASEDDLAEEVAAVRAVASSLLLVTCPATFRSLQGWVTTLPAGTDALKLTRTMDTAALAAAFPFTSPDLPRDPADADALPGILYGANTAGPGLVAWDRWAQDNHNSVTLAASGAGKSYLAKLEILRNAYQGTECWIIDPEDEYARLAAGTGGAYLHLGADGVRLNPFDLPALTPGARPRADALTRRALFAHTVIGVLLGGQPGPGERAALDRAIMAAYHHAGITADPRTWARPAPQLPHLAAALRADGSEAAVLLADRLVPFTEGTHSGMFAGPTTTRPAGHLVVFSLRDVPDELKAVATLLALDAVWRQVSDPAARRRRLVVVDEAWLLMRDPEGARFLFRMAKAARKHWAGLAVVTQDAEDVLGSDLGRAVIANAATQVLLRQAPQAIDLAAGAFRLSAGEKALLLSAGRGEGLLACGPSARVSFQALASPAEHLLCTSDPAELAALEAAGYPGPGQDPGGPGDDLPGGYPDRGQRHRRGRPAVTGRSLAAVIGAAGGPPRFPAAISPLGRYLTDPGAAAAHVARVLLEAARHQGPVAGPVLAAALIMAVLGRAWLRRRQHAALAANARVITVLAPPLADPAGGEALWGHLTGLLRPPWARLWHGQPHLGFEYAWAGPVMTISVWVPGTVPPGMIERAIEAAWPGAHAVTAPASPPLPPGALVTGGTLRLARTEILPLKTDHDADPLRALAAAGSGLAAGEHAIVQVLARPVTGARLRKARRAARQLRAGRRARLSSRLLDALTPGHPGPPGRAAARSDPELAAEVRASVLKSAGPQWDTQIRYATATTAVPARKGGRARDKAAQAQARARLRGLAHGIASATALYSGRNWLARRHLRRPAVQIAARRFRRGGLLSVPELAAVARLPADPSVPGLARAGARAVAPPAIIPVPGPGVRPLGVSDTGVPRPVGIAVADARHHLRVIGPTGTGKTTLITGQILADADAGRGVVFVDPKGDAVTDLLARLPAHVAGKVVLFDPADKAAPPCLNVLQGDGSGTDHDVITDNVTGIFRRIFSQFWGPRTDDIFRAACLTLLQSVPPGSGQVTLADIPALLTGDARRRRLTAGVRDPVLAGFWTWYEQLSEASRAHAIGPLMNKLRAFLLRSFARQAIAAGPSTFTMTGVLDHGGLCLARLPKGTLGEETAQLVGSFIVAATWQAASRRAGIPQHQRADAGLYIDECQNFLTLPYPLEDLLAEARAYRLAITMAHQNLAQLPADLAAGISANARSQVIFTASPEDARALERHTLPSLTAHDLSHLGAYQAAARLVAGSGQAPAFTLRTQPPPPAVPGRATMIRHAARAAYSGSTPRPAAPAGTRGGTDPRLHITPPPDGQPQPPAAL